MLRRLRDGFWNYVGLLLLGWAAALEREEEKSEGARRDVEVSG